MNKKGFSLAELLIVVAIIAVLVAIAIPVFSSQLERSREGVDAANIRSAYTEAKMQAISTGQPAYALSGPLKQHEPGWSSKPDFPEEFGRTYNANAAVWNDIGEDWCVAVVVKSNGVLDRLCIANSVDWAKEQAELNMPED